MEGCVNLDSKQPKREEVGSSMILEKAAILEVKASSHDEKRFAAVWSGLPE